MAIFAGCASLSAADAPENAKNSSKYNYPPDTPPVLSTKILGIGGLEIVDDHIVITAEKIDGTVLKNSKGFKKEKLSLKVGDEFQIIYPYERSYLRLDKIEGEYIFFSHYRKFLKKTTYAEAGSEKSYPTKMKAFAPSK